MDNSSSFDDQKFFTRTNVFLLIIYMIYVVIRVMKTYSIGLIQVFPDTDRYMTNSTLSFLDRNFWAGSTPIMVPIVYKIMHIDYQNIRFAAYFQTIFSVFSWGFLAFQIASIVKKTWLKYIAFVIILAFSCSNNIIVWDTVILSETFSISFMILTLAAWFWVANRGWSISRFLVLLVACGLFGLSRDTNSSLLLLLAGILVVPIIFSKDFLKREYLKLVAIFFVLIAGFSYYSASNGYRLCGGPFLNVLDLRILSNDQNVQYFAKHGMPVSQHIVDIAKERVKNSQMDNTHFDTDPDFVGISEWFGTKFKPVYMIWLLTHPLKYIEPLKQRELIDFDATSDPWPSDDFTPILPEKIHQIIYPTEFIPVAILIISIGVILLIVLRCWKYNFSVVVPLIVLLLLYPHMFAVWHGDALEVGRHGLLIGIQFFLCMWIFMIFVVDYLVSGKRI